MATAAVVRGIYDVAQVAQTEPKVSDAQVQQLVNFALSAKQAPDVVRASSVAVILSTFAHNTFDRPLVISARKSQTILFVYRDFFIHCLLLSSRSSYFNWCCHCESGCQ